MCGQIISAYRRQAAAKTPDRRSDSIDNKSVFQEGNECSDEYLCRRGKGTLRRKLNRLLSGVTAILPLKNNLGLVFVIAGYMFAVKEKQ